VKIRSQSAGTAPPFFTPSLPFFTLQVELQNNVPYSIRHRAAGANLCHLWATIQIILLETATDITIYLA